MSDVVWAAGITGLVGALGYVTTYLVAKRTSRTAIETAKEHAAVELAKIEGDLERLRREHLEAERSHRQGTYHELLKATNLLDMFGTGYPRASGEEFRIQTEAAVEQLNALISGVHLFAPTNVRDALGPLADALGAFGKRLATRRQAQPEEPYEHSFAQAWRMGREETMAGEMHLIEAMRVDVTDL